MSETNEYQCEKNETQKDKEKQRSSLAEHVKAWSHTIDFYNTNVITNIENETRRMVREARERENRLETIDVETSTQQKQKHVYIYISKTLMYYRNVT